MSERWQMHEPPGQVSGVMTLPAWYRWPGWQVAGEPEQPIEPPPRASFTFTPERPVAGEEVTFDASSSTPAELIDRYLWQVPIGADDHEGKAITATFTAAGRYIAYLVVHTVDGRQHAAVQQLDVADA